MAAAGTLTASGFTAPAPTRPSRRSRAIANGALGFAVFLGGFVIFEPAPYELLLAALLFVWFLFGLRLSRSVMPLLFLLTLFNFGGVLSSFMIADYGRGLIYVAVSYFLALTSVFFATVILADMGRLRLIFRVYVLSAVATTLLGIIGYFGLLPGFEIFTRYGRAMGAFQDPNVYAPFLALPILYLIYGITSRSASLLPLRAGALIILLLGLFLAFSRAGWGLALLTGGSFYFLLIVNATSARQRLKYIMLAALGLVVVVVLIAGALQLDAVANLFAERARAVQDYDAGRIGRFARHLLGFELALDHPFGIGALEFGYIFGEDTHNNFVKALMAYGWIGFTAWVAVMVWTLVGGFKLLFRQRPWLPYFQIAYVLFAGHMLIGYVIDTDHWRHFYLLIGVIWGCMALEDRWQREKQHGRAMGAWPVATGRRDSGAHQNGASTPRMERPENGRSGRI